MQYLDSGSRHATQALGNWLKKELTAEICGLRIQSGFFSVDGLAPFQSTLKRLAAQNSLAHFVIGSNDGETLEAHVNQLAQLLRLPRSNAKLGVVSYAGAYFHPKTYHLSRKDGSATAYVGSANLGFAGISSLHVEAGIVLDTRDGDPHASLASIAAAVDDWFNKTRPGMEVVADVSDVSRLATAGVLAVAPPPQRQSTGGSTGNRPTRPRLQPLVSFPKISTAPPPTAAAAAQQQTHGQPAVPQNPPYPTYILFAPGVNQPTVGALALSGATMPAGYAGLVVRLSRDSARHWSGRTGTANLSIPTPTVGTLRFGIYQGRRPRPRAEFSIEMRYVGAGGQIIANPTTTNVMVYGFAAGETGHGDVRLVIPRAPCLALMEPVQRNGWGIPKDGDVALLEWPTQAHPAFRLSFLEAGTPVYQQAESLLTTARSAGQLVGQGACWLPPGISPPW